MGAARKFLDLAFDFIVLVLGLGILTSGMSKVYKIQDEELNRALNGGGRLTYISDTAEECSGGDVVSYLLGRDFVPVSINGIEYSSEKRAVAISLIDLNATYVMEREYVPGEYGTPSKIVIIKQ